MGPTKFTILGSLLTTCTCSPFLHHRYQTKTLLSVDLCESSLNHRYCRSQKIGFQIFTTKFLSFRLFDLHPSALFWTIDIWRKRSDPLDPGIWKVEVGFLTSSKFDFDLSTSGIFIPHRHSWVDPPKPLI